MCKSGSSLCVDSYGKLEVASVFLTDRGKVISNKNPRVSSVVYVFSLTTPYLAGFAKASFLIIIYVLAELHPIIKHIVLLN